MFLKMAMDKALIYNYTTLAPISHARGQASEKAVTSANGSLASRVWRSFFFFGAKKTKNSYLSTHPLQYVAVVDSQAGPTDSAICPRETGEWEDEWRFSAELNEKNKKIQEHATGRVVIAEKDIRNARDDYKLMLYGKFFGCTPSLDLMPRLLLEFMNHDILLQLTAAVEKPIKLDEYIKSEMKDYKFFQTVAYENLINICYICGRVGHKEEMCNMKEKKAEVAEKDYMAAENEDEKLLGPWVQVVKKNRRGLKGNIRMGNNNKNSFTILDNPTYEDSPNEKVLNGSNMTENVNVRSKNKEAGRQ
ncbi:hypothetical protein Cni_G16323 [Canna indica]|uniref:CCHC-type domain-containing protein n=1 Tax=Canna indica TaxID=4628 RepID=A0AAQ3KFV3_9LILI|nr:hypothetical protein Cni_G16323 [Canna indica]